MSVSFYNDCYIYRVSIQLKQNKARLKYLENKFEKSEINILNCSTTMEMSVDIGGISTVIMNNVPLVPRIIYTCRSSRSSLEAKSLSFTICAPNPVGMSAIDNPMWALNHKIAPPSLSFHSEAVIQRRINAFFFGKFVQTDDISGVNVKEKIEAFFFRDEQSIAMLFSNWLLNIEILNYSNALKFLVKDTPLAGKTFPYLLNHTIFSFQRLCDKTRNKKEGFDDKLTSLEQEFNNESPAYKAVNIQRFQFLDKNAISYLAEEGFLPTAGLPTGIVEFDTLNIDDLNKKNTNKSKPSYFITRALSEFAPGNQIVIDGKSYKSEGIIFRNDRGVQAEKEIIQSCSHCGYQRIIEIGNNEKVDDKCPHCKQNTFVGINFSDGHRDKFTEMIQPAGFAVDIYQAPSRKISEMSKVPYVDPLLINIRPWSNNSNALFEIRESEGDAEILFYNKGNGNGYAVCLHCGRTSFNRDVLQGHKRLRGGKSNDNERNAICSGNNNSYAVRENVVLGGRFKTDFCEIRFKENNSRFSNDPTLLYSLGTILTKELAAYLAIEKNEIGFGLKRYEQFSTVFIFDTAKDGAGYASQFALYADKIFKNAGKKLEKCSCEIACTKCLIDRHTQWHINNLDRPLAMDWLRNCLNVQVPKRYLQNNPKLEPVIGSIKDEIGRLIYSNKIKKIWIYASSNINDWDFENLPFIDKLKNKTNVNLILINTNQKDFTNQDKITLIQISSWAEVFYVTTNDTYILKPLCKILLDDDRLIEYVAEDFEKTLNENWGNSVSGFIYKNPNSCQEELQSFKINLDNNSISITIDENNPIHSNNIADLLLEKLAGKMDLSSVMKSETFDIIYNDRYLRTPFGCILLVQFIDRLKKLLDFKISSFTYRGQYFDGERNPYYLFHNYQNADERNKAVKEFSKQIGISNSQALNDNLPHYRYFEFTNDKIKITIRPDAGIEYGWNLTPRNQIKYNQQLKSSCSLTIQKKNNDGLLYTVLIE
jgi:DEAD/DEAH box helicase domain-containing protein